MSAEAHQKLQHEYQEICGLYGHTKAQILGLEEKAKDLEFRMIKIMKKAQNLPAEKPTQTPAQEPTHVGSPQNETPSTPGLSTSPEEGVRSDSGNGDHSSPSSV